MADFIITTPDGRKFKVSGDNAEGAYSALRTMLGDEVQPAQDQQDPGLLRNIGSFITGDDADGNWAGAGRATADWLNRAAESMSFGLVGDEANARFDDMIGRGSYGDRLKQYRQGEENLGTWGRLSADLVGGMAPAVAGVGAIAAAPTLGSAMARGAALGAGAGAVNGFMEGEGNGWNRVRQGGAGGAAGAVIGGGIPAMASGARWVSRSIDDMVKGWRGDREIAAALGVKPQTARALSDTLGVDDPQAIRSYLDQAGPGAMLADAGDSAAGALDVAMQSPGRAARIAHERVSGRAGQAAQDLNAAMDATMGTAQGANALSSSARQASAPARQAAYDAAYSKPIDYSGEAGQRIEGLMRRVPGSAIKRANDLMKVEGEQSRQILAQIADDGSVTFQRMPDVRQLDYITRGLNDVAEAANAQGKLGGTTDIGRAYGNLSRQIRGTVREAVPEYGRALDTAADAISEQNALRLGADLFDRNTTREMVADALKDASKAERAAIKRGARSEIDERLANVRAVISDHNIEPRQAMEAMRAMSSPASQEKLSAVLGDDWPKLRDEIDKAGRALALRARTARNSATASRTIANDALNDAIQPGALRQGKPVQAIRDAISTATGASPRAVNRLRADSKAELADLLTRQGQGRGILDVIENARARNTVGPQSGLLPYLLAGSAGYAELPRASEATAQGLLSLLQQQ